LGVSQPVRPVVSYPLPSRPAHLRHPSGAPASLLAAGIVGLLLLTLALSPPTIARPLLPPLVEGQAMPSLAPMIEAAQPAV